MFKYTPPKSRWIFTLEIFSQRNGNFRHSFALHQLESYMALSCLSRLIQKSSVLSLSPFYNSLSFVQVLHCDVSEFMCVFRCCFFFGVFCSLVEKINTKLQRNADFGILKEHYMACIFHAPASTSSTIIHIETVMLFHWLFSRVSCVCYTHNLKCVCLSTMDATVKTMVVLEWCELTNFW